MPYIPPRPLVRPGGEEPHLPRPEMQAEPPVAPETGAAAVAEVPPVNEMPMAAVAAPVEVPMPEMPPEVELSAEPEAAAEDAGQPEADLAAELRRLAEGLEGLGTQFAEKLRHVAHEEKVVDRLHAELQQYKGDLYAQLLRPLLLELVRIRDSMVRRVQRLQALPAEEQSVSLQEFESYAQDIGLLLENNEVEIYAAQVGQPFAPQRQRATQRMPTGHKALHGVVESTVSDGYLYGQRVLAPAQVAVYQYDEQLAVAAAPQPEQGTTEIPEEEGQNG